MPPCPIAAGRVNADDRADLAFVAALTEGREQGLVIAVTLAGDRGRPGGHVGVRADHTRNEAECQLHSLGPHAGSPQAADEIDVEHLLVGLEAVLVGLAGREGAEPENEGQ